MGRNQLRQDGRKLLRTAISESAPRLAPSARPVNAHGPQTTHDARPMTHDGRPANDYERLINDDRRSTNDDDRQANGHGR